MPTTYTPEYGYYRGDHPIRPNPLFYIFDIEATTLKIYIFHKIYKIPSDTNVVDANTFFDSVRNNRQTNLEKGNSLLSFSSVVSYGRYNEYNSANSTLETTDLYLKPISILQETAATLNVNSMDPNIDFAFVYDGKGNFNTENSSAFTKDAYAVMLHQKQANILYFNTGFGGINFTDFNIFVPGNVSAFMTNIPMGDTLKIDNYNKAYLFDNRLKLKVTGPTTGNVGDVLEFTVTLMNHNFTDTWTSPPDVSIYPTTTAGLISHRVVNLVNGVGKFKVDTSHLYSGESFDVKVGWKYITNDSSVTVTLS